MDTFCKHCGHGIYHVGRDVWVDRTDGDACDGGTVTIEYDGVHEPDWIGKLARLRKEYDERQAMKMDDRDPELMFGDAVTESDEGVNKMLYIDVETGVYGEANDLRLVDDSFRDRLDNASGDGWVIDVGNRYGDTIQDGIEFVRADMLTAFTEAMREVLGMPETTIDDVLAAVEEMMSSGDEPPRIVDGKPPCSDLA